MDWDFPENTETIEDIKNYFIEGIDTEDIIPLWHLIQKQSLLDAFITLFRGTKSDILIRLFVLSEMVSKVDPPVWPMSELRYVFGYLSETAFDTVLRRLRDGGLSVMTAKPIVILLLLWGRNYTALFRCFSRARMTRALACSRGLYMQEKLWALLGRKSWDICFIDLTNLKEK